MQLGERPVSLILSTAALLLALMIGAIIPLVSRDRASRELLSWTPPPTDLVSSTVRVGARTPIDPIVTPTTMPPTATSQPSPTGTSVPPTATPNPPTPTEIGGSAGATPPATRPNLTASILVEPLNLRTGPGTDFPPLCIARIGEVYALRGRNADGSWCQVCGVQGALAWVRAEFVAASGAIDTLPIVP